MLAAQGAPAEAAAPRPPCRDPFLPGLWLTGREALKIPHTHREHSHSLNFGSNGSCQLKNTSVQISIRCNKHSFPISRRCCHTPIKPQRRLQSWLAVLQLYKYSDSSTSCKHAAQNILKKRKIKLGAGRAAVQKPRQ